MVRLSVLYKKRAIYLSIYIHVTISCRHDNGQNKYAGRKINLEKEYFSMFQTHTGKYFLNLFDLETNVIQFGSKSIGNKI